MDQRKARERFLADMKARGVGEWTSAPAITRLLWSLGVNARPLCYWGFGALALSYAAHFAPVWAGLMYVVVWRNEEGFTEAEGIARTLLTGALYGLLMAWWSRRKPRIPQPPPWEEYVKG
jgi:hypothetical protein